MAAPAAAAYPVLTHSIGDVCVQDSPPEWIPQETRAANHVLDVLRPYSVRHPLLPSPAPSAYLFA